MRRLFAALLLATPVAAQSFNMDVGQNLILYPAPSNAYGAAAGQTGTWNAVMSPYNATLTNLNGTPSTVTVSSTSSSAYSWFNSPLTGDDEKFMEDAQNLPLFSGPYVWTFQNVQNGNYRIYTYAWDPFGTSAQTSVDVPNSPDPLQNVGGPWLGSPHLAGVTYAQHRLNVSNGSFTVLVDGVGGSSGSINGFQLVFEGGGATGYCFGDGSGTACPCGNPGAAGNGCASSVNAAGANLSSIGSASISNDTFVLTGSGMPNNSALYFQGTTQLSAGNGVVFGDGLRCVGGTVIRLGTRANSAGASQYPGVGNLAISIKGNNIAGVTRMYQTWYRNPATFCTVSPFNLTNGLQVQWGP